jgi:hypothetical protein
LRERALDLPLQQVGDVLELSGEECDYQRRDQHDPQKWLLVQASRDVAQGDCYYPVTPTHLVAFSALPGDGCEPANFGLGVYPAAIEVGPNRLKVRIPTEIKGWSWASSCKTQYASDPSCGGVPHFLRCHLTVIKLLDHARQLGILESVSDESGFWDGRSLESLAKTVGEWNAMIAGLAGQFKDWFGDDVAAPILQYPNFEHLEANGQSLSESRKATPREEPRPGGEGDR